MLLLSPWDISSGRTRISPPRTSKGGGRFRGRVDGNVKTVNYLQKRVRARARASRHKRGFHLSRHFHHTADPIREYTREERVTREWVAGMVGTVKASLGLNRALDHIRERVSNIIHGNRGKKERN